MKHDGTFTAEVQHERNTDGTVFHVTQVRTHQASCSCGWVGVVHPEEYELNPYSIAGDWPTRAAADAAGADMEDHLAEASR